MRVIATVEIYNFEFSSFNHKPIHPKCKSKLTIGKKRPQEAHPILVVSSNQNKNGTNYQIHQNIVRIFSNHSKQGMATIRFKSPNHDVLISKADPIQLKAFLMILKNESTNNKSQNNNNNHSQFSTLTPFSNSELPKLKMSILNRLEYPITTSFPFSLTHLSINHIKMSKIDVRIFKLKHLKTLNLSDNNLREVPAGGWEGLSTILDLDLSANQIARLSRGFCCSPVAGRLKKLNMSGNQIVLLPWMIDNFHSLNELIVSKNLLNELPDSLTRLRQLNSLDVSHNKIAFLPGGFLFMRLYTIVLSSQSTGNYNDLKTSATTPFPPSLYELSARCVVDKKLPRTDLDTQSQAYMHIHKKCSSCSKACFESVFECMRTHNNIAEVVVRDCDVSVKLYACSPRCYGKLIR